MIDIPAVMRTHLRSHIVQKRCVVQENRARILESKGHHVMRLNDPIGLLHLKCTKSSSRRPLFNLEQQPLRFSTATMASKIVPYIFRAALRPARIASRSQCRAFTASPRVASDALQVVSRPSASSNPPQKAAQLLIALI